jgi:hypothetical protein
MCHDSPVNISGVDPFCSKKSYHMLFTVGAIPQRTVHVPILSLSHTNGVLCWLIRLCYINITLLTNLVNLKYNIHYTGTDTYTCKLLLTECHHFYSKLILTTLKILRLSRNISPPYFNESEPLYV